MNMNAKWETLFSEIESGCGRLRCSCCKARCEPRDPSWRFNGRDWEHQCPGNHPQCGYFVAEEVKP